MTDQRLSEFREFDEAGSGKTPLRTWLICGLMLLATMLNYMDRQTLAQQATDIRQALQLTNEDYGNLELGFGLAFATGSIATGIMADRFSLRWLFPAILLGWSAVGFATGWVTNYRELMICRILLGFFESGQWPCALAACQRLLSREQRPMGNSILQSGASLGAIATPPVILLLNSGGSSGWRLPFQVVGAAGVVWVVAWLLMIRPRDLEISDDPSEESKKVTYEGASASPGLVIRRLVALGIVVVVINLCWQYFRAWMPMMLKDQYGYGQTLVQNFSSLYYLSAAIGCLLAGYAIKRLAANGWPVHRARMAIFALGVLCTAVSMVTIVLPPSVFLLGTLLLVGFGSLGQFPAYYALTQEISVRQMGKVTGLLSLVTWLAGGFAQKWTGRWIDQTGSYAATTCLAGIVPAIGLFALLLLWNPPGSRTVSTSTKVSEPELAS